MEELFQILIILFFIGASIASSLKKKKQQLQRQASKTYSDKSPSTQKISSDILEDILGFKIEAPDDRPKQKESSYIDESVDTFAEHESWNPENEFIEQEIKKDNNFKRKSEIIKSIYESEKKQLKVFDKKDTKDFYITESTNKLQKLLLNPSNVKEYLIVSEILNKPKALRR